MEQQVCAPSKSTRTFYRARSHERLPICHLRDKTGGSFSFRLFSVQIAVPSLRRRVSAEGARKGVKHGIALAKALNAKVTVITVTEPLPIYYGSGHASGWIPSQAEVDIFDAACKERASTVIEEARAIAEQIGISAELLHVPNAHPATAIIETAKSRGCDLIVMGSHVRRGLRKLFLGSQTSEVLADGSVPVLIVP